MSYSALINWLKIVLPLMALGLLATLFMLGRDTTPQNTLPFIETLRERVAGQEGMRASVFTGSTKDGDAVKVNAVAIRQDPEDPDRTLASDLRAEIAYTDGTQVDIIAENGRYSDMQDKLTLIGDVVIVSSDGYRMRTEELITEISNGQAESPGPVEADGPIGQINAGRMLLTRTSNPSADVQLVFTDGVKVLYQRETNAE